jgi:D-glycero-alpha-D-manno-heptose 1-phosphate guanylyltransferase
MSNIPVLILVGGKGTRLQSVVRDLPKPMAPIAGKPFLEWQLRFLKKQGFKNITLLTGHMASAIEKHFGNGSLLGLHVRYCHEEIPLGTGGAVAQAMDMDECLVLNGDSLFVTDLKQFIDQAVAPATMALHFEKDVSRYGAVELKDGIVSQFFEKSSALKEGLINSGVYYLHKDVKKAFKKGPFSLEKDVFEILAPQKAIRGVTCQGHFIDIGIPESYQQAQALVPEWLK